MAIVILGAPNTGNADGDNRVTLDQLLHQLAAREPDRLALSDPPDRPTFTDGTPRRLTYYEADQAVSAIAGHLRRLGLPTDAVVGVQVANTVESALAILGVLRAGMIAALLPLLWRRADAVEALGSVGAKAIITATRIGSTDHATLAAEIAAELFSIRHICSFGSDATDGVFPLDDVFAAHPASPPPIERDGNPAAHVAIVTFDTDSGGPLAAARSHNELIAAGGAVTLEASLPAYASILTPCPFASFAGLALGLLPWLLTGGTLLLHHPFNLEAFAAQCGEDHCDAVVVPAALLPQLDATGVLSSERLRHVLALWRAPERLSGSAIWRHRPVRLTDVLAFGETGLIAARRDDDGRASSLHFGPQWVPRDATHTAPIAELTPTAAGTLALRNLTAPGHAFPPGRKHERGVPGDLVAVDTGYPCRTERDGTLVITGPPTNLINVGGYRFTRRALQASVASAGADTSFAVLPDALIGQRLAGQAADAQSVRSALDAQGANALIVGAFRPPP